jgi:hypothetical protein
MSIAQHHAEWLSLLEISGPFLSIPVLEREFPQGMEGRDPDLAARLRAAHEEWQNNQQGLRPDPALHRAWIEFVLGDVLELTTPLLVTEPDQLAAWSLTVAEYGETLQPDYVLVDPLLSASTLPLSAAPRGEMEGGSAGARLLVQALPLDQGLDKAQQGQHWKASPATRMMELLHATGVRLGIVTNGEQWMLVNAPKGETTGFISWYSELWQDEPLTLRAFTTLLRAGRFFGPTEGALEALLQASADDQQAVTDTLGNQVRDAVELLVQALDHADQDAGRALLQDVELPRLYRSSVTVMMRLVFLLSAEERGLLPLEDDLYSQHYAVSTLQGQLRAAADQTGEEVLEYRHDAWQRLLAAFRAVHSGVYHDRLHLPAYGGSLFDPDEFPFLEGRGARGQGRSVTADEEGESRSSQPAIRPSPLRINNRTVLHLLESLQFLQTQSAGGRQAQRLSFRALDIEQIGHVYEGLLDHTAVRAQSSVLGLQGTKGAGDPEIPLPVLEAEAARGEKSFLAYLKEQTGRSLGALQNALHAAPPDLVRDGVLRTACDNDEAIYRRVLPFHGLIRDDDYGRPVIIPRGSVYVTAGTERRATGTHYTPRSLTEPIVQHTLEPLVYTGPAEGKPRAEWQLRRPEALLALKVCDMAMGSGAFLVQACRYLSERLVESLEEFTAKGTKERKEKKNPLGSAQSAPSAFYSLDLLRAAETDDERLTLARRLVADRCLYGVDKNPLAVEMAKLSLWLITMDRGKPFTFLDHALKCGDSLVGVDLQQLSHWNLNPGDSPELFTEVFNIDIDKLVQLRREIEEMPVLDLRDQQAKAYKLAQANAIAHDLKAAADLLVGSYYNDLNKTEQDKLRDSLLLVARDGANVEEKWRQHADLDGLMPFHWPLEFPEVFLGEGQDGFDAFVGNPPFIGGRRVRGALGDNYRVYLDLAWPDASGNADYSAYFFLRGFANLRNGGTLGLIATNTIAQGDTRLTGLAKIEEMDGIIYRATNNQPWPGLAAVVVNVVYIVKGQMQPPFLLDAQPVNFISSQLDANKVLGDPFVLVETSGKSHMGTNVVGLGFMLTPDEALELISRNSKNQNVLFPYLNGQDLNSHPEQQPSRWIINFFDWPQERTARGSWHNADEGNHKKWLQSGIVPGDYPDPVAADYPECYQIVRERVYPERRTKKGAYAKRWWQYGRRQERLYEAVAPLQRVLVLSQTTKYLNVAYVEGNWVYAHKIIVFALDKAWQFSIMQSDIHESWARTYCSTLETRLSYTPTDGFETFPFPQSVFPSLQTLGVAYHDHRRQIMLIRQEGLTTTYNRFHDPEETAADIARLRDLHVEMDTAVAAAYGWDDLGLGHDFHETQQGVRFTISEAARREVLYRLLALNHQRYAEEVEAGLHGKKGKAKGKGQKAKGGEVDDAQLGLF